jgi:hypothetical protein
VDNQSAKMLADDPLADFSALISLLQWQHVIMDSGGV